MKMFYFPDESRGSPAAETVRMPDIFSKSFGDSCSSYGQQMDGHWAFGPGGLRRQVNFCRRENFFTWNSFGSSLKRKMLELAWGLHFESRWGRRTEDPFRGLRAGPVRYSPLFYFSPTGDSAWSAYGCCKLPCAI